MILGLTGSYGSGKTTVSDYLMKQGIPIIDADIISRELTSADSEGFKEIIKEFGGEFKKSDSLLDRKKLAEYVFSNPVALKKLEKIVHPLVRKREFELLDKYRNAPVVVLSVPLLFEKKLEIAVDKVLVIKIDETKRYERLIKNYKITREEISQRLKNQMSQKEKIQRADYIIDNSSSLEKTFSQVDKLLQNIYPKKKEGI
jgi:dephospho-CoA kinase